MLRDGRWMRGQERGRREEGGGEEVGNGRERGWSEAGISRVSDLLLCPFSFPSFLHNSRDGAYCNEMQRETDGGR